MSFGRAGSSPATRTILFRLITLTLIPMIASIEGTGSVAVARDLVKDPGLGSIPLQFGSVLA